MAVETFEDMTTAFSDMFDMEMQEDLSTEATATELMDGMVEMDMQLWKKLEEQWRH